MKAQKILSVIAINAILFSGCQFKEINNMSVSTTENVKSYTCDGVQKAFTFPFSIIGTDKSVLVVTLWEDATSTPTVLTESAGAYSYTVAAPNNNYENGGTISTTKLSGVVYVAYAWPAGYTITIERIVPYKQLSQFAAGGLDNKALEQTFDNLEFQIQQLDKRKSIHGPPSDLATVTYELPMATGGQVRVVARDGDGNIITIANVPTSGVSATAFAETLLDDATAGAARATLQITTENLTGLINVKDFGAKGDGVTDDTVAFNAALDYIKGNLTAQSYAGHYVIPADEAEYQWCNKLYLPAGTYLIGDTLDLFSFVEIIGESQFTSVIKHTITNKPLIRVVGENDPFYAYTLTGKKIAKDVKLKNLTLLGTNVKENAHTASTILNNALELDGLFHGRLENVYIKDFGGAGIAGYKIEWLHAENCWAVYCRYGLEIDGSKATIDPTITNNVTNTFIRCTFNTNHQGIKLKTTTNNTFIRCRSEENTGAVYNATTNGLYDGPKKQSDTYYLPSANVYIESDSHSNIFSKCYFEQAYVHIVEVGNGNYFDRCFFNPTDGVDPTADTAAAFCARHDIVVRANLIAKAGEDIEDGYSNQCHILFVGVNAGYYDKFEQIWFYNARKYAVNKGATYKTIRWDSNNSAYPIFENCNGLIFDDDKTLFEGTTPRVCIIDPRWIENFEGLTGVVGDFTLTALPTNDNVSGIFRKKLAYVSALFSRNIQEFFFACFGGGTKKTIYLPMDIRIGKAAAAPNSGTWKQGDVIFNSAAAAAGSPGWVCTSSGTFSAATDNTGDTDGSTAVITGMTDTSDFAVGDFVTTSAGFPNSVDDGNVPVEVLAITATTMTIDDTSDSAENNITVLTPDPVFKAMANLAA